MIVGLLQLELAIAGAESLKDKRRVLRSLKDRLHREHLVSIAEIARHENPALAVLGVACVGPERKRIAQTLDHVIEKARQRTDCEVIGHARRVEDLEFRERDETPIDADDLACELLRRASAHDAGEDDS